MVRQGYRVVIMLVVLVALLYLSPAYAQSQLPEGVPVQGSGQPRPAHVVKAGTPVTVLGRYHGPDPNCPRTQTCKPYTSVVVQLPNEDVVLLPDTSVNYQTQKVSLGKFTAMEIGEPLTPGQVTEILGLSDTGGVARLPLLGAVILIGSVLVARRMLH